MIVARHVEGNTSTEDVKFSTPDGASHVINSTVSSPTAFRVGAKVTVVYERANPEHARIDIDPWGTPVLLLEYGLGIALIGGVPLFFTARQAKQDEWLRVNGQVIEADFDGVRENMEYIVNGRKPVQIWAKWQNNVFKSDNLWADPTPYITSQKIKVMIDPANPKRYWMDITGLPK